MTAVFVNVPEVSQRVNAFAAEACIELFSDYGSQLTTVENVASRDDPLLSGVIGSVGDDLRVTCLIAANEGLLHSSCPSSCQARDWVGELANQLMGRLKMKLLGVGAEVTLTTPLAFSGVHLTASPRGSTRPSLFECNAGLVMLWTEVDATENFAFGESRPTADTGELILF